MLGRGAEDIETGAATLTLSQVRRARLTVASRSARYFDYFDGGGALYGGAVPLMDDISAASIVMVLSS
jgi:hypothetical protein